MGVPVRHGYRLIYQQNCFDTCETCACIPYGSVDTINPRHPRARAACACNLLAALIRGPVQQYSRRIVRRSEHAHHACGASWLAAWRPWARRECSTAAAARRTHWRSCAMWMLDLRRTASSSGRVRRAAQFLTCETPEALLARMIMVEDT